MTTQGSAVATVRLRPGARVLDVACGTGANFPLIQRRIDPTGTLVGVDLTPKMLAKAAAGVAAADWANTVLREADVCTLEPTSLGPPFDARDAHDAISETCTWGWVTAAAGTKATA